MVWRGIEGNRLRGTRSGIVPHLIQVAMFGVMVCLIAATALAVAPGYQSDCRGLGNRLVFFSRYCLPTWVAMELAVWVLTGQP